MFPNIRGFSHCLLPAAALCLIVKSSFKEVGVLSNSKPYNYTCSCLYSESFPFCDQKISLKYSPKSLKGSHCLLFPWFFSGRKPQVALTVSVVLLYCKTALNYNLFSTFIAGLLVIWFPKLCLFNVWFGHYFSNSYLTFTLASFHFFFLIYNLFKVVWWELFSWELEVTPKW